MRPQTDRGERPLPRPARRDRRRPRRWGASRPASPELRLDVALRLDEDVDESPVVKIAREEIRRNTALVEGAALFDLFGQGLEEVVILDAADDLVLVVEGKVARDRARQPSRGFFGLDEG